jgi:hypothetical protein
MRCFGIVRLLGIDPTADGEKERRAGRPAGRQAGCGQARQGDEGDGSLAPAPTKQASNRLTVAGATGKAFLRFTMLLAHAPACLRACLTLLAWLLTWQRSAARLHRVQQVSREGGHLDLGETPQLQKKGWNRCGIFY